MNVRENFIQLTCFRLEIGQEKSACRVSFILVLHVVIKSVRKANYDGASLKFAIVRNFNCSQLKATDPKTVILPRYTFDWC